MSIAAGATGGDHEPYPRHDLRGISPAGAPARAASEWPVNSFRPGQPMMRRLIRSTFAISLLCASAIAAQSAQPDGAQARVRYTINDGWRFSLEGVEFAEKPLVSDADVATLEEERCFEAHMLMEMAGMSVEDGMVMQLHPGSLRNHNGPLHRRFGTDRGADIPVATEYTRNLRPLLEAYGNDPRLRLIVFTLDESTYSRELAPLAGHYPALRLGPAWWFHDSIEGMTRFRRQTSETAGIYNTVGFNDDTRAFCSIPARHDLARRVDANWLAGLVARHVVDLADAREMARALAYDLVKEAYRL